MELNINNIIQLLTILSSTLIISFLTLLSIFNQDIKVLLYISGLVVTYISVFIITRTTGFNIPLEQRSSICDFMDIPGIAKMYEPSVNSLFIAFTATYMIIPMMFNNNINIMMVIFFVVLFVLDAYYRLVNKCNKGLGIGTGLILGILFGFTWFYILQLNNFSQVLYFGEVMSNNVVCSSKQAEFVCFDKDNNQINFSN